MNTTPVPPVNARRRRDEDVQAYNTAAAHVMARQEIPVADLYAHVRPHLAQWQKKDDVHFQEEGSRQIAAFMAAAILAQLPR